MYHVMHLGNESSLRVKVFKVCQEVLHQHRYIVSLISSCNGSKHIVHYSQEQKEVFPEAVTLRDKVSNE